MLIHVHSPETTTPKVRAIKPCEPGYLHVDVKYLPQMADERSRRLLFGVCQRSCPPISCGVSDFRGADFVFGVEPDGSGGLPVAGFA